MAGIVATIKPAYVELTASLGRAVAANESLIQDSIRRGVAVSAPSKVDAVQMQKFTDLLTKIVDVFADAGYASIAAPTKTAFEAACSEFMTLV